MRSDGKSTTFVYINILKFDYLHSKRESQKKIRSCLLVCLCDKPLVYRISPVMSIHNIWIKLKTSDISLISINGPSSVIKTYKISLQDSPVYNSNSEVFKSDSTLSLGSTLLTVSRKIKSAFQLITG